MLPLMEQFWSRSKNAISVFDGQRTELTVASCMSEKYRRHHDARSFSRDPGSDTGVGAKDFGDRSRNHPDERKHRRQEATRPGLAKGDIRRQPEASKSEKEDRSFGKLNPIEVCLQGGTPPLFIPLLQSSPLEGNAA